jgi:hypothetical protein
MRLAGKICCWCKSPPATTTHRRGKLLRALPAAGSAPAHLHVLHASRRMALTVSRSGPENTSSKTLNFPNQQKIFDLAEQGGYAMNLEGR